MCKTVAIVEESGFVLRCADEKTFETLKAAYGKQQPKKPTEKFPFSNCPKCKTGVHAGMQYCSICGQALDWSEEVDPIVELFKEVHDEAVEDFAHFLIDKAENGVIQGCDLPDLVLEWKEAAERGGADNG